MAGGLGLGATTGLGRASGAGSSIAGGRHIKYDEMTPMANLHLTLLDDVGVHLDDFADSNGRIGEAVEPLSL